MGYEDLYEVSDAGQVRSRDRLVKSVNKYGPYQFIRRGRDLAPFPSSRGYPQVDLCRDGRCKTHSVHVVIAESFLGPRPEGLQVLHANDVKTDNRLVNLRYGTQQENMADRKRNRVTSR